MAKEAHDREDLLREATAYDLRLEIRTDWHEETIFLGMRASDLLSIYVGQDTVYQFNSQQQLRRAFWQGRMLATYQHQLCWLDRPVGGRVRITRTPLESAELAQFVDLAESTMGQLEATLIAGTYDVEGQFPEEGKLDVAAEIKGWLSRWQPPISFAQHPAA